MSDMDRLAERLFGNRRIEVEASSASDATYTYVGTAESDSNSGRVMVRLDGELTGDVLGAGDTGSVELPCTVGVKSGDRVIVTVYGGVLATPVVTGVVGEGDAQNARIGAIEADYVKATELEADVAEVGFLKADTAEATYATIVNLTAATGRITTLEADHVSVSDLTAATGRIGTLEANTADIATIRANSAKVANLTAAELEADHATIESLETNFAKADLANVDNAWIEDGTIKNGAISEAMIGNLSANKITSGTLDASRITVSNLNADNITAGTLNGQRIGTGSLSLDKLADPVYTESEVDGKLATMQAEIDGAIETWTGTVVPTLNNAPANGWTTTAERDRHVGDVYFVVNAQSDQNGYNYRFTKTNSTYSWQLIKDNDVTNALQRITTIEQFDSDISEWKTDTDGELSTIKSNHTTLVGRVDKTIVETIQLWFTKADTAAPSKPTSQVTSTSTDGNAWRVVVPSYSASYPNYFYCYQWKYADGSYGWSDVTRDIGMGESQQQARKGVADAAAAQSTANTANTNASAAVSTANTAKSTADSAASDASTALSTANTAKTTADSAASDAATANTNASTALSTANTAKSTADSAASDASTAISTANTASSAASTAQSTANANIKSAIQLWFTKANDTAPSKPTAHVTTNNPSTANAWNISVPTYNSSYPYYFYCYEYQKGDGTYIWSDVVYDRATTENQQNSHNALTQLTTKVETSVFNELSNTVDTNTASITSLSEVVETKQGRVVNNDILGRRFIETKDAAELPLLTLAPVNGECSQDGTPTPEAPVPIRCVRGRNLAVIDTEHIKKPIWYAGGWSGSTLQGNGIRVTRSYGNGGAGGFYVTNMKAGQYVIQMMVDNPDCSDSFRMYIGVTYDGNQQAAVILNNVSVRLIDNKLSVTFTLDNDCAGVVIRPTAYSFKSGYTYADFSDIQLELGSAPTPYVPYGHIGVVSIGKNLFDKSHVGSSTSYVTIAQQLEVGETYTFSTNRPAGHGQFIVMSTNTNLAGDTSATNGNPITFTTTGTGVISFKFYNSSAASQKLALYNYQLELGSTATEYEPYHSDISYIPLQGHELYGLGDIHDELSVDSSGNVSLVKRCGKAIYDSFTAYNNTESSSLRGFWADRPIDSQYSGSSVTINLLCSHARGGVYSPSADTDFIYIIGSIVSLRTVMSSGYTAEGLSELNAILATSPLTLIYPLAEPVTYSLGHVDLPTVFDNGTVRVLAEIQPVIGGEWWSKDAKLLGETQVTQTNTTNRISQTADSNSSVISQLTTTLGTNADGTTKTDDVMHRTSAIEQDLSGFKTTVSSTYATKSELQTETQQRTSAIEQTNSQVSLKANAADVYTKTDVDGKISQEVNSRNAAITASAEGILSTVSETYSTKSETKQYDTGEGNPTVCPDAIEAPLRSLEATGWAEQDSTSGKNLLPNRILELNSSLTLNGLTVIVNSDGSVVISGTASASTNFFIETALSLSGTYVMSGCPSGGSSSTYYMAARVDNGWAINARDFGSGVVLNGSITEAAITIYNGCTCDNLTFYPQLEAGSTATEYEPYTGGKPSPNPDYPQEIRVAKGRNLLEIDSTTLTKPSWYGGYYEGTTLQGNGIRVRNSNSMSGAGGIYLAHTISAGTFVITFRVANPESLNGFVRVVTYIHKSDGTSMDNSDINLTSSSGVYVTQFTTPQGTDELCIRIIPGRFNSGYSYTDFCDLQLELGSTPTPYVPYGHVGLEVNSPKNLFHGTKVNLATPIPSGTVIVASAVQTASPYPIIYVYKQDGTQFNYWGLDGVLPNGRKYRSFTIGQDCYSFSCSNGTDVQVEIGSTPTEYTPYHYSTTPIPLPERGWAGSLPDGTHDTLTLDGAGKVTWEDTIKTCDLGTPTWSLVTVSGKQVFRSNSNYIDKASWYGYCEKLKVAWASPANLADNQIAVKSRYWDSNPRLAAICSKYSTEAEFKTAMTGVLLYYATTTPITEDAGYIQMPLLSEGCSVSIPELDELGISWYCAGASGMTEYADDMASRMSHAESSITQNADSIELKVSKDGVISSINQSAESVTIDASKININGVITAGGIAKTSDVNAVNAQEQLIYISAPSGTGSVAGTTTWVSRSDDVQNTWTTKRPTYNTSYPILFVATQRKTVGGTVTCTTPVRDDTTTVIDGGHITTGSIDADRIKANVISAVNGGTGTINADKINAAGLTIGQSQVTNLTADLATKANASDIPTDVSDLNNDSGFITSADVPTKVSDLTNDSGFQNATQVDSAITSKGYQTESQVNTAITSKGYATTTQAQGYATTAEQNAKAAIPTTVAELTDSGDYLTTSDASDTYATQTNLTTEINQRKATYGTCSTTASTRAKAVTCANFELVAGNELTVKFSTANTYTSNSVQLNVNGKGAKDVWVGNAVTSSTNCLLWGAGAYITFRYDGTQFIVIGEPRTWYGTSSTAASTAAKTDTTAVTGCVICKGATVNLQMTNANSVANPTLNIQSTGAKAIYTEGSQPTADSPINWPAASTVAFVFDGATWRYDSSALRKANTASKTATNYVTDITGGGVQVHPNGNTADRVEITANGSEIFKNNASVAQYGDTTRVGKLGAGNKNVLIDSNGMAVRDNTTELARFDDDEVSMLSGEVSVSATIDKQTDTEDSTPRTQEHHTISMYNRAYEDDDAIPVLHLDSYEFYPSDASGDRTGDSYRYGSEVNLRAYDEDGYSEIEISRPGGSLPDGILLKATEVDLMADELHMWNSSSNPTNYFDLHKAMIFEAYSAIAGTSFDPTIHRMCVKSASSVVSTGSTISFGGTYIGVSMVMASFGDDVNTQGHCIVDDVSTTGFKSKNSGSSGSYRVNWIAVGWINR